jgi:hypothetical protein
MESKKMIRIGMRLTEKIIEILKEELGNDEKGRGKNEARQKKVKRSSKSSG